MDPPDKSPHTPSARPALTRRMPSPSERVALAPAASSSAVAPPGNLSAGPSQSHGRSQTTLPPISHLHAHAGLAQSSMQPPPPPPPPPQRAGSPYMQGASYPLASSSTLGATPDIMTHSCAHTRTSADLRLLSPYSGVRVAPEDSDPETSQGRPKQKRRRQALSCTGTHLSSLSACSCARC